MYFCFPFSNLDSTFHVHYIKMMPPSTFLVFFSYMVSFFSFFSPHLTVEAFLFHLLEKEKCFQAISENVNSALRRRCFPLCSSQECCVRRYGGRGWGAPEEGYRTCFTGQALGTRRGHSESRPFIAC